MDFTAIEGRISIHKKLFQCAQAPHMDCSTVILALLFACSAKKKTNQLYLDVMNIKTLFFNSIYFFTLNYDDRQIELVYYILTCLTFIQSKVTSYKAA